MTAHVMFAPGKRVLVIRPDNMGGTFAFSILSSPQKGYERLPVAEQKKIVQDRFQGLKFKGLDVLAELTHPDTDFWLEYSAQVRMPRWSRGRFALVGDAGYCGTAFSGAGTTFSLVGAYLLAGELAKHPGDHFTAFAEYERLLRPIVDES